MEFDKRDMTLEEAIEVIKEIEPMHEQTISGRFGFTSRPLR